MTSLKKLIAGVAVSLPLAASAQQAAAPAPLYQIYGTLNVNAQWTEASKPFKVAPGATPVNVTSRIAVSTDSTNIGIKGVADTGQFGLGVVYQCESSAAVDGQGVAGICGRNSRLGLTGSFGTLFYGNWDTPFKSAWYGTKADDAFGNTDVYDAAGLMGSPGFFTKSNASLTATGSAAGVSPGTFNIRAANSIAYHSPKFEGAQLKAQYSANEFASNDGKITPQLWSVGLNYDAGPLSALVAYERHDDFMALNAVSTPLAAAGGFTATPGNRTNKDQGIRAGAGYELGSPFGTTTVGAVYEWLNYKFVNSSDLPAVAADTVVEATRSAFMVNLKHRTGNHEFRARYEYADGLNLKWRGPGAFPKGAIGTGAFNYALGYAYYLSKAAQVYAYYTKIENERFATYTFATAGNTATTTAFAAGADPMAAGLGMRYAF